jgi:hypothetical protein
VTVKELPAALIVPPFRRVFVEIAVGREILMVPRSAPWTKPNPASPLTEFKVAVMVIPEVVPTKVPDRSPKSTVEVAKAAMGRARASRASKTIRFINVFLLNRESNVKWSMEDEASVGGEIESTPTIYMHPACQIGKNRSALIVK